MKKIKLSVAAVLIAGGSLLFSSCIGSFALTKNVMEWNKGVGSKFVNELVFFAFWILPVYEVTSLADLLVLNSIEFWSGDNPMDTSENVIDTEQGRYLVACDETGYTVTHEQTGRSYRLDFDAESQTWSFEQNGQSYPIMTFIDSNHVRMIAPEGTTTVVELSEFGVMAYSALVQTENATLMASR